MERSEVESILLSKVLKKVDERKVYNFLTKVIRSCSLLYSVEAIKRVIGF